MYIAIEGLKGTGKSTLIKALLPQLNTRFCHLGDIQAFNPTKPIPNDALEAFFHERQNDSPFLQQLYAKRSNYHASAIDWNAAGLIISDRSLLTSLAVRWHDAKNAGLDASTYFQKLRAQEHVIAIPDIVIQLDASDSTLLERYQKRGRDYGKYEETKSGMLQMRANFQDLYQWLTSASAKAIINQPIDIYHYNTEAQSADAICLQILAAIEHHLKQINDENKYKSLYCLTA